MSEKFMKTENTDLNPYKLAEMLETLENTVELHSISVRYKGEPVLEGAWAPFSLDEPQMMHSLSKIGTSICVGFAVTEGKLHLEDKFLDYVREDLPENYDKALEEVTVYDLLTMQAGSKECCNNVWFSRLEKDWETNWLKQPKIGEDIGKAFHYDSGCSYTLSRIVSKVMGENCLSIMQKRVFDKMGFEKINWLTSPEGHNTGGWGMYLTARQISALAQLLLQKGNWNGEQLVPAEWVEEMGKQRVVIPGDEKKALTHYAYHIKAGKEIFAAEGAFGQYLICFRDLPVAIGITSGAREYLAADICLKYMKEAVTVPCPEEKRAEGQKYLEAKINSLSLPQPEGRFRTPKKAAEKLFDREMVFTENPRKIECAKITKEGYRLKLELVIDGEKKELYAGYKNWKQNDLYPEDFTKRYHCVAYAMDEDALYLSVGLINTSYREEYCLWVNSEDKVIGTWRPNVTYLPEEPDLVWKFTGEFVNK